METLVTSHEVKGFLAVRALPCDTFVTTLRGKALRLLAVVAYNIASFEATLAGAYRSHPILNEVHESCALEAEEVVQFVGTLGTLYVFEEFKWKLVAEDEEVSFTDRAFDERGLGPFELGSALGVDADDFIFHSVY